MGGGTPTTLSAQQLDRVLSAARTHLPLESCVEYTVEAGRPDTITRDKLLVLKDQPAEIVMAAAESAYAGISENELLRQTAEAISVEVCGRLGLPMPPDAVQTLEGMKEYIPDGEERRALEKVRETAVTFGDAVCKRLKLERGQPAPQREER